MSIKTTAGLTTLFATIVVMTNWHYKVTQVKTTASGSITTGWNIDGPSLVVLFSLVAGFFVARAIYREVRVCLDEGIRVPKRLKLIAWEPCLLLLPLLVKVGFQSVDQVARGIELTKSWGYGSDASWIALICAALLIVGFQVYAGLGRFIARHRMAAA